MYQCKYPDLFSSVMLGNVLFRNRIFASPTGVFYADPLHRPLYEAMCYYERKAKGGAASVCVGDATVDGAHGAHGAYSILMEDEGLSPALNKLAMTINRHGAVAALEMFHAGSAASVSYNAGNDIYGPQDEVVSGALGHPPVHVRAMTRDIMDMVADKHVAGVLKAKACGFGMVTLHFAHGFLMHQFMSPTLNHRTDEYGGSFENRMRFPLEVLRAVRAAVGPKFPIEVRISGSEVYDGGYDIDYGCRIAAELDGIADLIHVSAGSHEDARVFTVTHPSMFLEDGVNVKYAAEIKKHIKYSKVATVGALSDPELLQEIIASGKADVVEMARGLICDPDLPDKARDGRADEITRCVRCFTCFSSLLTHGQIVCALNPEIADEAEQKHARPPAKPRRVLVAGGGVAGMEAAIVCAGRGHEVTLCERSDKLGGVLRCEDGVPFKRHLREYLDQQAARVRKSGARVMLNTAVTKALAEKIAPDVIIAAIGASPAPLKITGGELAATAEDIYISPEKAGRRVVILGGGLVGCELAVYLGNLGREVTVLELLPGPGFGDNILHGQAVGIELDRAGVKLHFGVKADEITQDGVWGESGNGRTFFECDTVISAVGLTPLLAEAEELRFAAPYFYQIGDCLAPKNIYEATRAARQIALDVGER
jgi:2,4-dienoyl-CoA reductase-like NADH-dependent reductase (Old Yellow Enzyme family)/NADPH-dependent 2,4-dienoyl-CoA reductase/sulfur reductase-like enzyme